MAARPGSKLSNKLLFSTIFLFVTVFILFGAIKPSWKERLDVLNKEIVDTELQIHQARREALNAQMDALNFMRIEWDSYLKEVASATAYEDEILSLETRLQELKNEREALSKQYSNSK